MSTALLIPTRGRANKLVPLLENIKETTEVPYTVYFIIDIDDLETRTLLNQLKRNDFKVVTNYYKVEKTPRNYNVGYEATTEPYIAILADDYVFHPGWLSDAIKKIGGKGVLAFGDRYAEGWGIFLVKREYIETYSGVVDEPNKIFHEYNHEFADAEFQFTARSRDQIVYSDIFLAHKNPKRLGTFLRQWDGSVTPQPQILSFYHQALPEYDIKSITKYTDRIDITLIPRDPVEFDMTYAKNSMREKIEADQQEFSSRAHLWGGQVKETIFKRDVYIS